MKVLTLHQPWASLIAHGIKTIETRSWGTRYRGPIAIHAGAKPIGNRGLYIGDGRTGWTNVTGEPIAQGQQAMSGGIDQILICPLGAIVATAELVDVVPMVANGDPRLHRSCLVLDCPHEGDLPHQQGGMWLIGANGLTRGHPTHVEDQRPYGDFTPGRYAWLLDDIKPTTERCPECWGQDGVVCFRCMGIRGCAPIPAKGKQGLWDWTP